MEANRRDFMRGVAAAGAGLLLAPKARAQQAAAQLGGTNDLNIGIIGCGAQGRVLIDSCLRIPNIRFKAVCDIWDFSQKYAANYLSKYKHEVTKYEDYKAMLAAEAKNLDAMIVATPDWMHAEHAMACMNAGLHVYCEKEMSNSLDLAKQMVLTARSTGKLLQIGHQRRSNPRYLHAINTLIRGEKLLGRVTHAYGQWNRSKADELSCPAKYTMDAAKLSQYGYGSMTQLLNWRWYKKYGGGPIVDLGSHQIDLFSWLWGASPSSVTASGGTDFYKGREWYDNVLTVYEYPAPEGVGRAFYQVLTTTKHGGFYECFMGENGAIVISEVVQMGNVAEREAHAPEWDSLVKKGYLLPLSESAPAPASRNTTVDVRVTAEAGKWPLPTEEMNKPAHQPHLENFFNAVRAKGTLNCPAELAYETAVAVLAANRAVATGRRVDFTPAEFKVA